MKETISLAKENHPPLEGKILNLASGEWGIISYQGADAIIAASLDECAMVLIRQPLDNGEIIAGGVHYQSPEKNKGQIAALYQKIQSQIKGNGKHRDNIAVTIVWGRKIHYDNQNSILEELERLAIANFKELSGAAQAVLIISNGKILLQVPAKIRKQIRNYYIKMKRQK